MTAPLGYTPPDIQPLPQRPPVRTRHVFYVPGYDPEAKKRYRSLFVRELIRYAKRFDVSRRAITPVVPSADGLSQTWSVEIDTPEWSTRTVYEVLLWDDIVNRDFGRSLPLSMVLMTVGLLHIALTGTLFRLFRLNWKYGCVMLYPFVMTLLLLLGAGLVGTLAYRLAGLAGAGGWLAGAAGAAATAAVLAVAIPRLDRYFVWHLLHDWVFNWQHGNGWRSDYEARLDGFGREVAQRIASTSADEVMLIGHSSGALTAVEIAGRTLAQIGPSPRPSVALVTLGAGIPLVALQPGSHRLREELSGLVSDERIAWADYQAPQDWMNFPGFNPIRDLDSARPGARIVNPTIRSAKFREVMTPQAYEKILYRPFRTHFQFLMANDLPGEYDFFALTLGPQRLGERMAAPRLMPLRKADAAA